MRMGHSNLLCTVPFLVYMLPKHKQVMALQHGCPVHMLFCHTPYQILSFHQQRFRILVTSDGFLWQ
jgi:hypothetical protein